MLLNLGLLPQFVCERGTEDRAYGHLFGFLCPIHEVVHGTSLPRAWDVVDVQ